MHPPRPTTVTRIDVTPFRIPFRRALLVAGVPVRERAGWLIRLGTEDGAVGIGEASPHPTAPGRVLDDTHRALATVAIPFTLDLARWPADVPAVDSPAAQAGLEMACADLAAQAAGVRLAALLGPVVRERVPVNALLAERAPRAAAAAARELAAQGFRCIKVKVAPDDPAVEDERLARIRAAVGPRVALRVDLNAALSVDAAVAVIRRLAVHGIEYVEQPVSDLADLAAVRRAVDTPIAADESVTGPAAVERIAAAGAADVIVVKPALLGLAAAAAVVRQAAAAGLSSVITSTLDTSFGIAAALHLAATLPDPLRPCGLATAALLSGDLAAVPLRPHDGHLSVPDGPGLGLPVDEAAVARWRVPEPVGEEAQRSR